LLGVGIAGLAVLAVGLASVSGKAPGGQPNESALSAASSEVGEYRIPARSQMSGMRLASLPGQVTVDIAPAGNERRAAASISAVNRALFDERFASVYRDRSASFDERFAAAAERLREPATRSVQRREWLASAELPELRLETPSPEVIRLPPRRPTADALEQTPPASLGTAPDKPVRLAYAPSNLPLTDGGIRNARTAIYDISARAVYMPNGEKLEAHSGLGEHMDDLRTFRIKNKGVTPPNVYKLTLREKLFHGVRAVRMTPVDPTKMHGRDGFLVHSYLLGPNGESNGCVSVASYDKFIKAFDDGEVDRLIVVERLENPPSSPNEPGTNWLAERIKALFDAS
jgi:hypothetical protein